MHCSTMLAEPKDSSCPSAEWPWVQTNEINCVTTNKGKYNPEDGAWLKATYHMINTAVGVGLLALPKAFATMGWVGGTSMFIVAGVGSYVTAAILVDLNGKLRRESYSKLADDVCGRGFAKLAIYPFQALLFISATIIYILLGGTACASLDLMLGNGEGQQVIPTPWWIVIFGLAMYVLSLAPDMSSLWQVSMIGTLAAILIPVLCFIGSALALVGVNDTKTEFPNSSSNTEPNETALDQMANVSSAIGAILLSFAVAFQLPDIQESLKLNSAKQGVKNDVAKTVMSKALKVTFAYAGSVQLLVGLLGFAAYGTHVSSNVLSDVGPALGQGGLFLVELVILTKVTTTLTGLNQSAFVFFEELFLSARNQHTFLPLIDGDSDDTMTVASDNSAKFVESSASSSFGSKHIVQRTFLRSVLILVQTLSAMFLPSSLSGVIGITGCIGVGVINLVIPLVLWSSSVGRRAETAPWKIWLNRLAILTFTVLILLSSVGCVIDIVLDFV